MRVFNLAEELEKERQKNKELVEKLEEKKEHRRKEIDYWRIQYANLKDRIDKAIEYVNKFESIKAYFEYTDEDGYDEYDYDDEFRNDLLDILKGDNK